MANTREIQTTIETRTTLVFRPASPAGKETKMMEIQRYMVPGEMEPVSHYCHAVRAGDRLWISGTVGVRPDGSIPEDTADQFQVAMDSLNRCLLAAGGRPEHIVKVTVLLTDINDRAKINLRTAAQ